MNFTVKSTSAKIFYLLVFSAFLAHFFIALGRNDALWGIFWQPFYYVELMYVGFIVFLVSLLILWIWNKLDQRHPWQVNFRRRLLNPASSFLQSMGDPLLPPDMNLPFLMGLKPWKKITR